MLLFLFSDSAGETVLIYIRPCHKDHVHGRADAARGEEEGISRKQMGSTVCGLPGVCSFAIGSSEMSYSGTKERERKTLKPINIQKKQIC